MSLFSTNPFRLAEVWLSYCLAEKKPMSARAAKPVRSSSEEDKRAQRIFARLVGGESIRAIATSEALSVRRVQQIVREQLDRRDANPADDFALLQIARLERVLDLVGGQIDAGKPSAAHAYVRILDHLNRLAPDRLRLKAAYQRVGDEVDKMENRLGRLDAAREALALRQASPAPSENAAKRNRPQAIDNKGNRETADFSAPNDFRGLRG
jgi:hypothetical protein